MHHVPRGIDEVEVSKLLDRLRPLVDRLAAETGFVISIGKATYTRHNIVLKLEAALRGSAGVTMGREAEAFVHNAIQFGLQPDDLGRDFQHLDTWYRIVGMKPRSKHPVVCAQLEPPSKVKTVFPAHMVRHYLEQHGLRTKVSPHARIKVEFGGEEPPGELPAVMP